MFGKQTKGKRRNKVSRWHPTDNWNALNGLGKRKLFEPKKSMPKVFGSLACLEQSQLFVDS